MELQNQEIRNARYEEQGESIYCNVIQSQSKKSNNLSFIISTCALLLSIGVVGCSIYFFKQIATISQQNENLFKSMETLSENVKNFQVATISESYYQGYQNLSDGWVTLFNGYQYKPTREKLTWSGSRKACNHFGGDLAVHGIQTMEGRQILHRRFPILSLWIGLKKENGTWYWINRNRPAVGSLLWGPGEPNGNKTGGEIEECGEISSHFRSEDSSNSGQTTNDLSCFEKIKGLCEKTLSRQ